MTHSHCITYYSKSMFMKSVNVKETNIDNLMRTLYFLLAFNPFMHVVE